MKHHPLLLWTGRHGCWCECSCGWLSRRWTSVVGAHLQFGQHLIGQDR